MKIKLEQYFRVWLLTIMIALAVSCSGRERSVDKDSLLGNDYRLYQDTPAWNLAKAVRDEETESIKRIVAEGKVDIDYQEPKFGNSLLMLAVQNRQYDAVKALLELGADPNLHDKYNGSSAIIDAAGLSSSKNDDELLRLLLEYGADPNDEETGKRREGNTRRNTALLQASGHSISRVKILVEAGAKINYKNEFGVSPLSRAYLQDKYDVVLYLLEHGADYNTPIIERSGKKMYLGDMLKELTVPKGSDEYKQKLKITAFLEKKGVVLSQK